MSVEVIQKKYTVEVISRSQVSIIAVGTQGPAGPQGIPGNAVSDFPLVAETALSGQRVVSLQANGKINYTNPAVEDSVTGIVGVTTGAIADGAVGSVRAFGFLEEATWNWTAGDRVFVGASGILTQTPVISGFLLEIGRAMQPTKIFIDIKPPILLA